MTSRLLFIVATLITASVLLAQHRPSAKPADASPEEQAAAERRSAALAWIGEHAIPLKTAEAGSGFEDMRPLGSIVGDARIVLLGEATHGTREFFQLKHRMLEYLVERKGFTLFGIEATMPEAFDIDRYVLTGEGDPATALAALYFWTWNTEEVLELIRWMRRYNADPAHTRKVRFYGFDMQRAPRAVRVVESYLARVDRALPADVRDALTLLGNPFLMSTYLELPLERRKAVRVAVKALAARFDANREHYAERSAAGDSDLARQHVRILEQFTEMGVGNFAERDRAMAENTRWILDREGPDAKMVAWAHNGHVALLDGTMGKHLRGAMGDEPVRIFGFSFNQGGFQAVEMPIPSERGRRDFRVGPAPPDSFPGALAAAGLKLSALDLRSVPADGPAGEWFAAPRMTRSIGAGFQEEMALHFMMNFPPPRLYDAMLFVETTTAARGNPNAATRRTTTLAQPANLGFEEGAADASPAGWEVAPDLVHFDFKVLVDDTRPYQGKRHVTIRRARGRHYGEQFGSLSQQLHAEPYHGKRIRLRAAVAARVADRGKAYFWLRVGGQGMFGPQSSFHDNMADRPITARKWQVLEMTADVPETARTIDYGLALVGEGRAYLDAVSLDVVEP